ncbi:hypothetical protein BH11ACT3_BH11ACT3_25380 [soil metagenome]
MTDNQQWQAQEGRTVQPTTPAPASASPLGAPGGPPPQQYPGMPLGWTPPPKPGVVPLRPMTLGTILSGSFQVLRRNPRPTLGPALIISIITTGLQTVGQVALLGPYLQHTSTNSISSLSSLGALYTNLLGSSVPALLLGVLGTAILQGIIALEVGRALLGDKQKLAGLLRQLKGRLLPLIGWGFLLILALAVAGGIVIGPAALLLSAGGAAVGFGVLILVLGSAAVIAGSIWLGTRLIFVPSSIVLERLKLMDAVRRSWSLTTGFFWRTFGIQALVNLMIAVGVSIVTTPVSLIFSLGGLVLNPNGSLTDFTSTFVLSTIVTGAVTAIIGSVGNVVQVASTSLMYVDLRMRKEGLDLDLARYVEARAAGATGLPDPYKRVAP